MAVNKDVQDKYEEDYHTGKIAKDFGGFSEAHWTNSGRWRTTAVNIVSLLKDRTPGNPRILEIGCGPGSLVKEFKAILPGCQPVGLDISFYALSNKIFPDLNLIRACASELPFQSNIFDMVMAFDVIEHLPYPYMGKILSEVIRVSKDTVDFMITVPLRDRDGTENKLESEGVMEHYIVQPHQWWVDEISKYGFAPYINSETDELVNWSEALADRGFPFNMAPENQFILFVKDSNV